MHLLKEVCGWPIHSCWNIFTHHMDLSCLSGVCKSLMSSSQQIASFLVASISNKNGGIHYSDSGIWRMVCKIGNGSYFQSSVYEFTKWFKSVVVYNHISYPWLSARLQYIQCVSNREIAGVHWAIDVMLLFLPSTLNLPFSIDVSLAPLMWYYCKYDNYALFHSTN